MKGERKRKGDKMDKKRLFDILYVILILAVVITCIYIFFWLQTDSTQCLNNPLTYYQNKTGASCSCFKMQDLILKK